MLTNIVLQVENRSGDTRRASLSDRKGWNETLAEISDSNFRMGKNTKFSFFVADCVVDGLTVYQPIRRHHTRVDFAKDFYGDLLRLGLLNAADLERERKLEMFLAAAECVSIEKFAKTVSPSGWTSKIDFAKMSLEAYASLLGLSPEELEEDGYRTVFVDGAVCVCKVSL